MPVSSHIIRIEPSAPAKPPEGAACNGCGVCCLSEPCPLGMVLSRKRSGACVALRWDALEHRYYCGAVQGPWAFLARRWISAGTGCDSTLQPLGPPVDPVGDNANHD
jgi:hypothetical protein